MKKLLLWIWGTTSPSFLCFVELGLQPYPSEGSPLPYHFGDERLKLLFQVLLWLL